MLSDDDRYLGHLLDAAAAERDVRVFTIDRPGGGRSSPVALEQRFAWSFEAFLAVLEKHNVHTLHLLSHSNGILYSLYTLLHLLGTETETTTTPRNARKPVVLSYTALGPYVPPWLSGHKSLTLARYIPGAATSQLGYLASLLTSAMGVFNWSSGIAADAGRTVSDRWSVLTSSNRSSSLTTSTPLPAAVDASSSTGSSSRSQGKEREEAEEEDEDVPRRRAQEWRKFKERNERRPRHKKQVAGHHRSEDCLDILFATVTAEGKVGLGQEALVCLALPDARMWGWGADKDGKIDESMLFERGFTKLKARLDARCEKLRIAVYYGAEDGFVPAKGRAYLRDLLVTKLSLMRSEDWHEVPDAGHDDVVNREVCIYQLLDDITSERQ